MVVFLLLAGVQAATPASEMVKRMALGTNLGNTLEAPNEGEWGPAAQEYFFDAFKSVGFKHVRIPVRWDNHTSYVAPYNISQSFMDRVDQVVGWALARGFIVVLNTHHEDWLDNEGDFWRLFPRFQAIWQQIAEHFKNKPDTLLFEVLNEPHVMNLDQLNYMNQKVIPVIRASNPTRIIIVGGLRWMSPSWIKENWDSMNFPRDDYTMLEVHSYDPFQFTTPPISIYNWGSESDITQMWSMMGAMQAWSEQHKLPVYLGEYGVSVQQGNKEARKNWYRQFTQAALTKGIACAIWDDNGWFQTYNRGARTWDWDVLHAIGL